MNDDARMIIPVGSGQAARGPGLYVRHVSGDRYILRPGLSVLANLHVLKSKPEEVEYGGHDDDWTCLRLRHGMWLHVDALPSGRVLSSTVYPSRRARMMKTRGETWLPLNAVVIAELP